MRDNHMRHVPGERNKKSKIILISLSEFTEIDNFTSLVAHVKATAKNMNREYREALLIPSGWYLPDDKKHMKSDSPHYIC